VVILWLRVSIQVERWRPSGEGRPRGTRRAPPASPTIPPSPLVRQERCMGGGVSSTVRSAESIRPASDRPLGLSRVPAPKRVRRLGLLPATGWQSPRRSPAAPAPRAAPHPSTASSTIRFSSASNTTARPWPRLRGRQIRPQQPLR
jgi:hypothetical protein